MLKEIVREISMLDEYSYFFRTRARTHKNVKDKTLLRLWRVNVLLLETIESYYIIIGI